MGRQQDIPGPKHPCVIQVRSPFHWEGPWGFLGLDQKIQKYISTKWNSETCWFTMVESGKKTHTLNKSNPRKKNYDFPWNTGGLIGIFRINNGLFESLYTWVVFHPLWFIFIAQAFSLILPISFPKVHHPKIQLLILPMILELLVEPPRIWIKSTFYSNYIYKYDMIYIYMLNRIDLYFARFDRHHLMGQFYL